MYQFLHLEDYSLKQNKQKGRNYAKQKALAAKAKKQGQKTSQNEPQRNNYVKAVISEVLRLDGFADHIERPELSHLNNIVFGCGPEQLEEICENYANNTKDKKGRKLRGDASCMLAGVVSYERSVYEFNNDKYELYKTNVVSYLKNKYGERLKCVYEHLDEDHPHLHFYIVPQHGEKIEDIHEGRAAVKNIETLKEKKAAYNAAMSKLQDDFFNKVAKNFGFTRLGPARTRTDYKAHVQYKKDIAKFGQITGPDFLKTEREKAIKQARSLGQKQGQALGKDQALKNFENENIVNKFITNITTNKNKYINKINELQKINVNLNDINRKLNNSNNLHKNAYNVAKKELDEANKQRVINYKSYKKEKTKNEELTNKFSDLNKEFIEIKEQNKKLIVKNNAMSKFIDTLNNYFGYKKLHDLVSKLNNKNGNKPNNPNM